MCIRDSHPAPARALAHPAPVQPRDRCAKTPQIQARGEVAAHNDLQSVVEPAISWGTVHTAAHRSTLCGRLATMVDTRIWVVGGGIVGLAVARRLLEQLPGSTVTVLEKEDVVGSHQTGHNLSLIHI